MRTNLLDGGCDGARARVRVRKIRHADLSLNGWLATTVLAAFITIVTLWRRKREHRKEMQLRFLSLPPPLPPLLIFGLSLLVFPLFLPLDSRSGSHKPFLFLFEIFSGFSFLEQRPRSG